MSDQSGVREFLEYWQIYSPEKDGIVRVESIRGSFSVDKDVLVQLVPREEFDTLTKERDELRAENGRLIEDLRKIANHETLDGDKYNNYEQAYLGVVEFAAKALRGADEP